MVEYGERVTEELDWATRRLLHEETKGINQYATNTNTNTNRSTIKEGYGHMIHKHHDIARLSRGNVGCGISSMVSLYFHINPSYLISTPLPSS